MARVHSTTPGTGIWSRHLDRPRLSSRCIPLQLRLGCHVYSLASCVQHTLGRTAIAKHLGRHPDPCWGQWAKLPGRSFRSASKLTARLLVLWDLGSDTLPPTSKESICAQLDQRSRNVSFGRIQPLRYRTGRPGLVLMISQELQRSSCATESMWRWISSRISSGTGSCDIGARNKGH